MTVKNVNVNHVDSGANRGCCDLFTLYRGYVNAEQAAFYNGTTEYAYLSGGIEPIFSADTSQFSLEFRTSSTHGVLWWESEWSGSNSSDFLIIHLRKGQVYIAVNLGNDTLKSVTTNLVVTSGKWHRVAVER
ncbi:Laminin G domain protein [Trichostrongylus colubriformis]|uniref:Laminin G domain protein n=2 Tax=Trichostrongylus colubriformis TaxID=6319 RepID=A0AAN8F713_TRICO